MMTMNLESQLTVSHTRRIYKDWRVSRPLNKLLLLDNLFVIDQLCSENRLVGNFRFGLISVSRHVRKFKVKSYQEEGKRFWR